MLRARSSLVVVACALSAAASRSAAEPPSPTVRVLRVKAVADETFREQKDWEKEIREHLAWSDEKLRQLAGIGLEVVAVEPWRTHRTPGMTLLLNELRAGVEKDGAEAVIGFTGHPPPVAMMALPGGPARYPVPFAAGIAFPLGDRAVIRRTEWEALTRHTLIHEIAHLFGGLHVDEESLLETATDRMSFRLDPFNRRVLDLTRNRDFDRGVREMSPDELGALVELYRQAPRGGSRDPDTAIRVAYVLLLVDEIEDALEELRQAVDIAPEQTRDVLRHAVIPELEARARRHGPTLRTRYGLAQAHFLAEDWPEAAALLEPGCAAPAEDPPSCVLLGAALLEAGELDRAEAALRTALRRDDSRADAHAALARVWAAVGRHDEAIEQFGRAQELDPANVDTHFGAGQAHLAAGQPGAAEASLREVLRLDEARDDARSRLALALARQGRGKEARSLLQPFEARRSLPASVLRDMAEVHFLCGDTERAFDTLQLAKRGGIDVEAVETLIARGAPVPREVAAADLLAQARAYYRTGQLDTARTLLERAVEAKPREARVHYWLGRVALGEDAPDRAREHFQRSLELDPDDLPSRYEMGRFAYDEQDFAAAVAWLEPCVEGGKGDSSAHFMLGRSEYELGRLNDAEEHLRTAIRKRADDGDFFYFLGRVLLEQGRDVEGRRELELAVDSRSLPEWRREDAHLRLARLLESVGEGEQAEEHVEAALALSVPEGTGVAGAPSNDGIEIVRVAPSPATALPRGQEVRIRVAVRFDLRTADWGTVLLAPQDEGGATLLRPQPRATVGRGTGEVTLEATVTTPASGGFLDVFLVLHAGGSRTTTAATRARYGLE